MDKLNEVYDALAKQGFKPDDAIISDGKLHRFARGEKRRGEKSAWYVCHRNMSEGNEEFYVIVYNDWREGGEPLKYVTGFSRCKADERRIEKRFKESQARADAERRQYWEEQAELAGKMWLKFRSIGESEYLRDKGIKGGLYGARVQPGILYVPLRDLAGKLWGYQKIFEGGGKYFRKGSKKEGNFHLIGSWQPGDLIYLAEGFATAVSVHLATGGKAVACAFDSGNLGSVAAVFREASKDSALIICGDDDRWTTKPDGTPHNSGRESAEAAATRYLGKAIFPNFEDLSSRPTDFNDLHVLYGVDEVARQLGEVKPEVHRVRCLGYIGNTYYYSSSDNQTVVDIAGGSHSKHNLFGLMPLEYWESQYPSKNGVDWDRAVSELMATCRANGIFHPESVRGAGVWLDQGRTVVNLGDKLWVDGEIQPISGFKSTKTYEVARRGEPLHGRPLTAEEGFQFAEGLALMRWKKSEFGKLAAGWLMMAPLSGAISWRPHIWLLAPTGSGKTWFFDHVANPILGSRVNRYKGMSTEAGVRQEVRSDALPLIFDEFETNDKRSSDRVQLLVELFRQASSESETRVVKGTATGRALPYQVRFSALVASIRLNLEHEQDRNRFTVLEMNKPDQNEGREQFEKLEAALKNVDAEFGRRMFARGVTMLPVIRENVRTISGLLRESETARFGDHYGALLAGYAALIYDRAVTATEARVMINLFDLEQEAEDARDHDESDCLGHLMQSVITTDMGDKTRNLSVAELVRAALDTMNGNAAKSADESLRRIGLHVSKDRLAVAVKHPQLTRVFRDTQWQKNWSKPLLRVDGAKTSTTRFHNKPQASVTLPRESVGC